MIFRRDVIAVHVGQMRQMAPLVADVGFRQRSVREPAPPKRLDIAMMRVRFLMIALQAANEIQRLRRLRIRRSGEPWEQALLFVCRVLRRRDRKVRQRALQLASPRRIQRPSVELIGDRDKDR